MAKRDLAPAQPGNVLRLAHGGYSPRASEGVAREIAQRVVAAAPYLANPKWQGAVEALAVTEARLQLLDAFFAKNGLLTKRGRPWAVTDYAFRLERLADNLRTSLGLTPASNARLGRNVAGAEVDLAKLWAGQGQPPVPLAADEASPAGADAPQPEPTTEPDAGSGAAGVTATRDGDAQ